MSLKGLYAITDEILTPDSTVLDQVKNALEGGVKILQYRNKHSSDEEAEPVCRALQDLCRLHEALFIIDDRPYLAHKIGADGLHIGKDDASLHEARTIFPKGVIGVSCYGSIRKALEAQADGADYVAFGSFFPSPTKPHSGIVSKSVIEKAKKALSIPVCAIGGIDTSNIGEIASLEPDMIAIVNAVWNGNISQNIQNLQQGMKI